MSFDFEDVENNSIAPQDSVADATATHPLSTKMTQNSQLDSDEDVQLLDADTALNTAIYSDAPIKGPDWFVAKVTAAAAFANRLPGTSNWSIGNGPGSLANQNPEEAAEERAEKDWDQFETMMDLVEEQQKAQREEQRQEWLASDHTYAGQTMSGEDWKRLIDWFDDPAHEAEWEDAMMAETGQSRAEVKRTGGKIKRYTELMQKIADRTPTTEEQTEFKRLDRDKDVRTGIEVGKRYMEAGRDHTTATELDAQATTSAQESTMVGSSLIASRAPVFDVENQEPSPNRAAGAQTEAVAARANFDVDPLHPQFNPAAQGSATTVVAAPAVQPAPARVEIAMTAGLDVG